MKKHTKETVLNETEHKNAQEIVNEETPQSKNNKAAKDSPEVNDSSENLKEEISMLNDKYLRLAAEFDNYRKRTLKEKQDLILFAGEEIIKGILPVLDDFDRAIEMLSAAGDGNSTALEGTELIYNKLKSFLTSKGVTEIDAIGCSLDTDLHEAVAQVPVDDQSKKDLIVDVVQRGYLLNGKVIRFSKVVMGQ
jgi:molecular chaperone GrpE